MKKRVFSLALVLVLIFGIMTTSFAQMDNFHLNGGERKPVERNSSIARDERAEGLKDKDRVRIIIELEDKPIIDHATRRGIKVTELDGDTYNSLNRELVNEQQRIKANIEREKIYVEYENEFTNVINGFSGSTTFENAKKIEQMPGVKKVSIANEYERPQPHMDTSKDIIETLETWNFGYNGERMVVSIIDTGIDPSHKDMKLTNPEKGRITEKDFLGKDLPGKFYTEKVPYGYNYMDNNDIILDLGPDASEHGMHVAGTVGANGEIEGIAPEAQLLAMKVFGNDPGWPSTFGDVIIKAIDDSIALGADVINMSLGSTASFVQPDDPEQMAVERATENGVVCSISAGNENHIGDGHSNPYWENPDYGVVGSPGLSTDSIGVASIENTHMKVEGFNYEGGVAGYTIAGEINPIEAFKGMELEYIDCGIGAEEDFEGKDLNGKIALIIRGDLTFIEKIENAEAVGAAGVIVYNNAANGDEMIYMAYPDDGNIPAVFIGNTDGKKLLALIDEGKNTIEFKGEKVLVQNSNSGKMSVFTSWGPTPDLEFKPEITAPGGQIYSTLQNDKYGVMSGTSMAAPHVAGGSALVLQRVDEDFGLTGKARAEMAKNLIMSTAKPVADRFGLVSPRRGGSGVMNLYAATTTPAIVTDANTGISKVNLKEIGDNVEFDIIVKNFSDEELSYNLDGVIQTDLAANGEIWMEPQPVLNAPMVFEVNGNEVESVTVPANSSTNIKVKIDLSDATDWAYEIPLSLMPEYGILENGMFIDGFIILTEETDTHATLNIPYMGFYGDWDNAPIFDKSVYDKDAEDAFYGVTALTWFDEDEETYIFLGFPFGDEEELLNTANIAFSPNGDGIADTVVPIVSFMRNAKDVQVNILDKHGDVARRLSNEQYVRKNYFNGGRGNRFNSYDNWEWDGEVYGEVIEGQYTYQIKARIDYPNAEWQVLEFPVKVDITAPTIKDVNYDKEKKILTIDAEDNMTPIYKYEVVSKDKVLIETDENIIDLSELKELPYELTVRAYDYALNFAESDTIRAGEDTTIPHVYMEKPEPFEIYNTENLGANGDIDVEGYVVDKSGLVELKINGEPVEFEYDSVAEKYFFATKLYYEDGVHKILVEGKDKVGNEIKFERTIFVDATNPELELMAKPKRIVDRDTKTVKVKLKVWENSGDIKVIVHGNEAFKEEVNWVYIKEFNPIEKEIEIDVPLKYGENNIKVIVEDGFGNKIEKVIGRVYRKLF